MYSKTFVNSLIIQNEEHALLQFASNSTWKYVISKGHKHQEEMEL